MLDCTGNPDGRHETTFVECNDYFYMIGAMTGHYTEEPPMSHIQIYDPEKDQWTQGGEIPKERQRGGAGTVVYEGKIYMACGITLGHTSGTNNWFGAFFGGETATAGPALNRTWAFDTDSELWTELAPMNQGRHGSPF